MPSMWRGAGCQQAVPAAHILSAHDAPTGSPVPPRSGRVGEGHLRGGQEHTDHALPHHPRAARPRVRGLHEARVREVGRRRVAHRDRAQGQAREPAPPRPRAARRRARLGGPEGAQGGGRAAQDEQGFVHRDRPPHPGHHRGQRRVEGGPPSWDEGDFEHCEIRPSRVRDVATSLVHPTPPVRSSSRMRASMRAACLRR